MDFVKIRMDFFEIRYEKFNHIICEYPIYN